MLLFCGAADQFIGTAQLLDGILDCIPSAEHTPVVASDFVLGRRLTLAAQHDPPFAALVFKTIAERYGKLSCLRVYSGVLRANSTVFNARTGREERIGQLVLLGGKQQIAVAELGPGDQAGRCANRQCVMCQRQTAAPRANRAARRRITAVVKPRTCSDLDKLSLALHHMLEEDPSIILSHDISGATLLSGLGESHLQILAECIAIPNEIRNSPPLQVRRFLVLSSWF